MVPPLVSRSELPLVLPMKNEPTLEVSNVIPLTLRPESMRIGNVELPKPEEPSDALKVATDVSLAVVFPPGIVPLTQFVESFPLALVVPVFSHVPGVLAARATCAIRPETGRRPRLAASRSLCFRCRAICRIDLSLRFLLPICCPIHLPICVASGNFKNSTRTTKPEPDPPPFPSLRALCLRASCLPPPSSLWLSRLIHLSDLLRRQCPAEDRKLIDSAGHRRQVIRLPMRDPKPRGKLDSGSCGGASFRWATRLPSR